MSAEPDWFGGDVVVVALPRSDGRTDLAPTNARLAWAATGEPLADHELERMRLAGEADPPAVLAFLRAASDDV